jgi:nitric oxide reductase large subunit
VKRPRVFSYTREHPAHASLVSNSKEPDFMKWFMLAVLIVGVALALFVELQTVK